MKKSYLKTPRVMNDFIYKEWFIYNEYDGNGRKTPKYIQKQKTKEKSPVWLPSHPPVYKIGGWLFSGAKEPETRWDRNPNL